MKPSADQVLEVFEAYPSELGLFMRHVRRDENGCWLWTGAIKQATGYASFQGQAAHRVSHELFIGPIPEGLVTDHLCRVRHCVNPAHLEAVTFTENVLRGESPSAKNARKVECPRGHALAGENVYINAEGGRSCLTCRRESARAYRERKAAA